MCTIYLEPIDGAWLELAVALAVPLLAVLRPHLRWRWKLMVLRREFYGCCCVRPVSFCGAARHNALIVDAHVLQT